MGIRTQAITIGWQATEPSPSWLVLFRWLVLFPIHPEPLPATAPVTVGWPSLSCPGSVEANIQPGCSFACSLGWLSPAPLSEKTRLNFAQPKPNFPEVCCLLPSPPSSCCSTVDQSPHTSLCFLGSSTYLEGSHMGPGRWNTCPMLAMTFWA